MNRILLLIILFSTTAINAQYKEKGSITGKVSDLTATEASLPFVNIIIKDSKKGTISDLNGNYTIEDLEPGTYTLVFSFIGYEKKVIPAVEVSAGEETKINAGLELSSTNLDQIIITTVARQDSETASLLKQKKAVVIKESIGAQELARAGVSDAEAATTKISGVSGSEASGDIFVRGLGDRYLSTTLNGLPLPSDDTERKNIDLGLFPVSLIGSLGISKTFSVQNSADQASGTINIVTRELSGKDHLSAGVKAGINSAVVPVFGKFIGSPNTEDFSFGFHTGNLSSRQAVIAQEWIPKNVGIPINYTYSISAGREIGKKTEFLISANRSTSWEYKKGIFKEYRSGFLTSSFSDAEVFSRTTSSTGAININYEFNENNELSALSLLINKLSDQVYTAGKNAEGYVYEETSPSEGLAQFVRDQQTQKTFLWVNQLSGEHTLNENNHLSWALGFNTIAADQPLRTRNEINFKPGFVQLGRTGGFQQRKSTQSISETEINGTLTNSFLLFDRENHSFELAVGADFRDKRREFYSVFTGVEERNTNTFNPGSLAEISQIFTRDNFEKDLLLINQLQPDRYNANLNSYAGFISGNYSYRNWNINAGLRYQNDLMKIRYDVGNIPGRTGSSRLSAKNLYPALNIKFEYSERSNIRFAASKTITLPEFKEVAPFEYVSQTGQVTRGNPDLEASTNYNFDLKWEYFPSPSQLISLTGFYKKINDPINKVQDRGSAGVYSFFNSGEQAEIYGLELETNLSLLSEKAPLELDLNFNISRLWHRQDLKIERDPEGNLIRTFRYDGLTHTGLQGASDLILNSGLSLSTKGENLFIASVMANYASDKIFALGAPEIQSKSKTYFNSAIIEEGFVKLDAVFSKEYKNFKINFSAKNLLNPLIKRTQKIKPVTTGIETTEIIRSYYGGRIWSLGINYSF